MKRTEEVYMEILFQAMEKKNKSLTQSYLAKTLNVSLSVVNLALQPLRKMNSINVKQRSFDVIDCRKILYCWASVHNLDKDIIYATRAEKSVREIESEMPADAIYAAYSGYKFMFKDVPADYSEVYAYSDSIEEIEKRFPKSSKTPNIFILKKGNIKRMTAALLFVDLWNIREWYAKEFLHAMEARLDGILE
jgi:predicted transcriptional regulator